MFKCIIYYNVQNSTLPDTVTYFVVLNSDCSKEFIDSITIIFFLLNSFPGNKIASIFIYLYDRLLALDGTSGKALLGFLSKKKK